MAVTINTQALLAWIKGAYDKALLFLALFGLLLSLIFLIWMVDRERDKLKDLGRKPQQARILSPQARLLHLTNLNEAIEALLDPARIAPWPNRLMTAALRVSCVKCFRPIPFNVSNCPFQNCAVPQPAINLPPPKDDDQDGMHDEWELKHGLNPNADDARQDADADGFTNLEEFRADTHPRDASSHPPLALKLRIVKVGRVPVPFNFWGVQPLSTNEALFTLKKRDRDIYARLGDTVDGYQLVKFEEKYVKDRRGNLELDKNVSELTVSRNNKLTILTIYRENQGEWAASLIFLVDQARLLVKLGEVITLKNSSYKVVDIKKDAVIVADINSGMEIPLQLLSEADKQLYPGLRAGKPDSLPDLKP